MRIVYILFTLCLQICSAPAFAHENLCDWPDPGYKIGVDAGTGIDKATYNRVLDEIEKTYTPIFQRKGYRFQLHRTWSSGTINAQAWWSWAFGYTCHVEVFGGIARYRSISAEAVRQVALHEIGHCIGGFPYYSQLGKPLSVEGQADYYSTLVGCRALGVDCGDSSLNLAKALASMGGDPQPWRPGPALPPVSKTYEEHPIAQCRLNTFDAGIARGARPSCWFR